MIASPRFQRNRARAVTTTFGSILAAGIVLFLIPAPAYTTTEGVVWLPENAIVRAGADGFVRAASGRAGQDRDGRRSAGRERRAHAQGRTRNPAARVAELETRLATERFTDRVQRRDHDHGTGASARRARDRDRSRRAPHRAQPERGHVRGA